MSVTAELIVMVVGAALLAIGAGLVFVPAGLMVGGALMVAVAWPDEPGKDGDAT